MCPLNLSFQLFINLFSYQFIHQSIYQFIYLFISLFINLVINLFFYLFLYSNILRCTENDSYLSPTASSKIADTVCRIVRQLLYTLHLDEKKKKKLGIETKNENVIEDENFIELTVFATIRYLLKNKKINEKNENDGRRTKTKFQILNSVLIFLPCINVNNIFINIMNNDMMYDNNLKLICPEINSNLIVICNCLNMALEIIVINFENDFNESREEVESSENILMESEEASMFVAQLVNKVKRNFFFHIFLFIIADAEESFFLFRNYFCFSIYFIGLNKILFSLKLTFIL